MKEEAVTVQHINDDFSNRKLNLLVRVTEDVMLNERMFRDRMNTMLDKIVEETIRSAMVRFGDAMNEVLSLENLRNLVIAELQKRVTTCAMTPSPTASSETSTASVPASTNPNLDSTRAA